MKKQRTKLKGRPRGRVYSEEEKAQAIKLVELYGNVSRVSRELNISRPTLMSWLQGIPQSTKLNKIAMEKRIEKKLEENEAQFLERARQVKENALERMNVLINQTKSLRDVTQAFSVLSSLGVGDKDKDFPQTVHNTFINRIYQLKDGKKSNNSDFDNAEIIDDNENE